jgi:hypothetical protein
MIKLKLLAPFTKVVQFCMPTHSSPVLIAACSQMYERREVPKINPLTSKQISDKRVMRKKVEEYSTLSSIHAMLSYDLWNT